MLRSQVFPNQDRTSYFLLAKSGESRSGEMYRYIWIMLKYKVKLFGLLACFLVPGSLQAGDSAALHAVNIVVVDQTRSVRKQAFQQGLDEMFVRLSGDSAVMAKLQRPDSQRYVQRFSYQPLTKVVINSQGEALSQRIKIQYSGNLIKNFLRKNGLAVWNERRQAVVVWLAVRDGKREYVLKNSDRSLIKTSLTKALSRRGIPERWPVYDTEDKDIVSAVDIRGGFTGPLSLASKRYSRGPVFSGSLNWNGKLWQSSWELIMDSGEKHWSFNHKSYKHLINTAVDHAADAMGAIFAEQNVVENQQLSTVLVDIEGVDSIKKYNRVEHYLSRLSAVVTVSPMQTDGDKATFEIILRSSEAVFLSLIKNDGELLEVKVDTLIENAQKNAQIEIASAKKDTELAINASQIKPLTLSEKHQTISEEVVSPVVPSPDDQASHNPVYHYRLAN